MSLQYKSVLPLSLYKVVLTSEKKLNQSKKGKISTEISQTLNRFSYSSCLLGSIKHHEFIKILRIIITQTNLLFLTKQCCASWLLRSLPGQGYESQLEGECCLLPVNMGHHWTWLRSSSNLITMHTRALTFHLCFHILCYTESLRDWGQCYTAAWQKLIWVNSPGVTVATCVFAIKCESHLIRRRTHASPGNVCEKFS